MKCREYIFELTSGRLEEAGRLQKVKAFQHIVICHRCRSFTRNDQRLTNILIRYRSWQMEE